MGESLFLRAGGGSVYLYFTAGLVTLNLVSSALNAAETGAEQWGKEVLFGRLSCGPRSSRAGCATWVGHLA